jgi:hypothetical protein
VTQVKSNKTETIDWQFSLKKHFASIANPIKYDATLRQSLKNFLRRH